jgi:hypothetical protein
VFPDLLTGPPFHYLSSLIRRVGSSVVPPPSLGSPRGSSRGGGGAGGLLLLLAYPYQHGCHYSWLLSRHRGCQEGVEGYRGHTMPFLGYALGYLLLRTSSAYLAPVTMHSIRLDMIQFRPSFFHFSPPDILVRFPTETSVCSALWGRARLFSASPWVYTREDCHMGCNRAKADVISNRMVT